MASLYAFLGFAFVTRLLGALGIGQLRGWYVSLRGGLAGMFVLTGSSHFIGRRDDLIAIVPPALPHPDLLVTLTGVAELLGAVGLLHRRTAPWAGAGLGLLLVAIFPANIHAAASDATIGGQDVVPLVPRFFMQVLYVTAALVVARPVLDRAISRERSPRRTGKMSDWSGRSSVHIRTQTKASPDRVWELLADGPSWTQWARFDEVEYEQEGTPAPHGLGAVRRIRVGRLRSTETVLVFEPPRRFSYDYVGTLPFGRYRADVTLTPSADGTVIDWRSHFTAKYPLTTGVLRRVLIKVLTEISRRLAAAALEQPAPPDQRTNRN